MQEHDVLKYKIKTAKDKRRIDPDEVMKSDEEDDDSDD